MNTIQLSRFGLMRVAAVVPRLWLGKPEENGKEIIKLIKVAAAKQTGLIVFPELSITGYTLGDLFHQELLQEESLISLQEIVDASKTVKAVVLVGLPLACEGKLFNMAAVISGGKILGLVPKTYIPGYKEFYEERWFASSRDLLAKEITILGKKVPIGADLIFQSEKLPAFALGVEICEDVWMPMPPSSFKAVAGATVLANLSASNELIGKADYRRELVSQQSARTVAGYIYASCGVHESTTDVVFSGHALIGENGGLLKESERFDRESQIIYADLDLHHIKTDRERMTSFGEGVHELPRKEFRNISFDTDIASPEKLERSLTQNPFVPSNESERDKRAQEIFAIQAAGLAKRMEHADKEKPIIGLSGGLDSTLALLVAVRACELLGLPRNNIHAYTMPGFATTKRTKSNAIKLAEALGVTLETIDITEGASQNLKDIGHNGKTQDITFENVQARYRTLVLMNKSNQINGLVVGTGDLSEIALGWNTFTGDHISHYCVNSGIPKTLVKYLVQWVRSQKDFSKAKKVLADIIATPISPELVRAGKKDIDQKTEDIIGPYELHDFFLYHFVRWASAPKKILFLAEQAFGKKYPRAVIKKWLRLFVGRFFRNQWKRSVMSDGPKVGSVALSPRGDWRMPSDVAVDAWLKELE